MAIRRSGSGDLNQSSSVRSHRIAERRNYTDACVERGADSDGIARGTNRIYSELYDSRPHGNRDEWTEDEQKKITIAENFAANRVRSLPTPEPGSPQAIANDAVVNVSGEAARSARQYCNDYFENGNYYSRLYGSQDYEIVGFSEDEQKPVTQAASEREFRGTFSNDLKRLGWVIAGVIGWLLIHKLIVR